MAEQPDHAGAHLTRLTVTEVNHLADRLFARGSSRMLDDMPSTQGDMVMASRALRAMLNRVDRAASLCGDAQSLLRNLTLEIET